jgi:site-specific recombinase XerD
VHAVGADARFRKFQALGQGLEAQREWTAQRLQRASAHGHTHASHSIAQGTRVEIEQQILGHASLDTATVYVTTESKRRMKAMVAFWRR